MSWHIVRRVPPLLLTRPPATRARAAQIVQGVVYVLKPHTLVTLGVALVAVWLCAPARLALAWDTNFQERIPLPPRCVRSAGCAQAADAATPLVPPLRDRSSSLA